MTKYLFSTLVAAAAMAVPAFSYELIASWDFSTTTTEDVNSFTGSVTSDTGYTLTTGGSLVAASSGNSGYLDISSGHTHTTVDVTNANVTLDDGLYIVLTISSWNSSNGNIFGAIATDKETDAAAIGQTNAGDFRHGSFYANKSDANIESQTDYTALNTTYPLTVVLAFEGDTLSLYEIQGGEYVLISAATMTTSAYEAINGQITNVAIGSWDSTSTSQEFGDLHLVSASIYSGLPEPSMFGLMFGLGAIGLVGIGRRRR